MAEFLGGRVVLHAGDCREVLKGIADASIDSVVTDPPYALVSIANRFGADGAAPATGGPYKRTTAGFMGKRWDNGEAAFAAEFWAEVLRVLKPGGHVLAFGGTRTYHRLACAIEAARFFKSVPFTEGDLSWNRDHANSAGGYFDLQSEAAVSALSRAVDRSMPGLALRLPSYRALSTIVTESELNEICRLVTTAMQTIVSACSPELRPPKLSLKSGPANVAATLEPTGIITITISPWRSSGFAAPVTFDCTVTNSELGAQGSDRRLYYTAKADADDRIGSKHPTVKPLDLMQYLVRLVTPPNGTILDPFAGTGTTGEAAFREGFKAILIEREPEYQADIARRMELAENPTKRSAVAKTKNKLQGAEGTPLFGDA